MGRKGVYAPSCLVTEPCVCNSRKRGHAESMRCFPTSIVTPPPPPLLDTSERERDALEELCSEVYRLKKETHER